MTTQKSQPMLKEDKVQDLSKGRTIYPMNDEILTKMAGNNFIIQPFLKQHPDISYWCVLTGSYLNQKSRM